ncbi:DUF1844 domain-containing protein [candidate division KSB1 bacterium]
MNDAYFSQLFKSLVLNFQMSAMVGMGKVINPVTQKAEKNLDEAKISIDMLNMLEIKTKNNLSDDEKRFLQHVLTDLRLNFVQEKAKPEPEEEKAEDVKPEEKFEKDKTESKKTKKESKKKDDKKEKKPGKKTGSKSKSRKPKK